MIQEAAYSIVLAEVGCELLFKCSNPSLVHYREKRIID